MRKTKQAVALVLTLCMLCCGPALSARAAEKYPVIWVKGAFHELYYIAEDGSQSYAFGSNSGLIESITGALGGGGDKLLGYLKELNFDAIADSISGYARELFAPAQMNPDGSSVHNLDGNMAHNRWELENPDGEYTYDYDWRLDPLESARRLHAYIQLVKQAEQCDKVNISVRSGSGPVGLAYLAEYLDEDDVAGMFFTFSIHQGSTVFGDLATKNFTLNADALINTSIFLEWNLDKASLGDTWTTLETLNRMGLLSPLLGTASILARKTLIDKLYEDAIIPMVLCMPVFWSYVPAEYYDAGIEACFGNQREEYAGLLAILDRYHNTVAVHADDILTRAAEKIRIGMISAFGTAQFPLGPDANTQGDLLVGVPESSSGAIASQVGEVLKGKLGKDYQQKNDDGHDHLSPDGTVDASTCVLPETTWFVSGMKHFDAGNETITDMIRWFFHSETMPTVFTDTDRYPQFMWRELTDSGYIDIDMPKPEELSAGQKILNFLLCSMKTTIEAIFFYLK